MSQNSFAQERCGIVDLNQQLALFELRLQWY